MPYGCAISTEDIAKVFEAGNYQRQYKSGCHIQEIVAAFDWKMSGMGR